MQTLVTVTCTRDKWFMVLQSYSIDRFVIDPCIHFVIIEDGDTTFLEWKKLLSPFYKKHALVLLDKNISPSLYPICGYQENMQGWQRQQLLKLNSSKLVNSEDYLNLDTKDIFVKECFASSFNKEGNDQVFYLDGQINLPEGFRNWIEQTSTYTGIAVPDKFWGFESPFLFKTEKVLKMISGINVEELFLKVHNFQSEYLLYRFFTDEPLSNELPRTKRFMHPADYKSLSYLQDIYNREQTVIFTIHRKSLAHSTECILNFFISINFPHALVHKAISTAAYWHQ
jgi:hypothetical protein